MQLLRPVFFLGVVATTLAVPPSYKLEQQRIPVHNLLKLTLADWGSYNHRDHKGPGTYAYGYDIEDPFTGNVQFKQEERHQNGTVTGSYGYVEPSGRARVMHYVSDHRGYRVRTEDESQPQSTLLGTPLNEVAEESNPVEPPSLAQLPPTEQTEEQPSISTLYNQPQVVTAAGPPSFVQQPQPNVETYSPPLAQWSHAAQKRVGQPHVVQVQQQVPYYIYSSPYPLNYDNHLHFRV